MNYRDFKKSVDDGVVSSIYLFEGEETFFFGKGLDLLKSRFITEPQLNFTSLNSDATPDELISSLQGYPFMSEKRMTVIREFYPKQDFMKRGFKDYLENPSPDSILLILNEKPAETLKKFKSVATVECKKADTGTIVRWIKSLVISAGLEIDSETCETISEYCLSDMTRIGVETEKLISYALNDKVITKEMVEEMVRRDAEYKIYEMTDFIGRKKFDKALDVVNDLLRKGMPPQMILVSVYNYYRRLLHVAISDMTVSEIAKAFNIKEFAVRKTKEQANMFRKRALKSAVDILSDADYQVKSGKNDINEKMWLVIFRIMTE